MPAEKKRNVVAVKPASAGLGSPSRVAVPASGAILLGRGRGIVDVLLPHPTVCLRHAKIFRRGAGVFVADLRSTYGTFVDGRRVLREAALAKGTTVSIGPFTFIFDGDVLVPKQASSAELAIRCSGVSRIVTDRLSGQPLTLLHDVSLAIRPRQLVCLIGPSGSGKSTLLSVLSGRVAPEKGCVVYAGRNLHAEFDLLKHDLALVPQRDALHQSLTVEQSLWYAAGLRLPSDTTRAELQEIVDRTLREVGLEQRRSVRIRELSGGQVKRISLANEIAHRPNVVFLDEVTSGLDELGDRDMMELFRGLAEDGRSVVCITHNTLNIERYAHLVVVLTAGGRLACIGPPQEVNKYFGVGRLGDVYGKLATKPPAAWESQFRSHPMWRQAFEGLQSPSGPASSPVHQGRFRAVSPRRPIRLSRQLRLLGGRVFALQVMDIKSLAMALGQAVFVAAMLVALFGDLQTAEDRQTELMNCRMAAFLMLVSIFWLGCNNAAPEIVKERLLFERERAVSVNSAMYYVAKLVVLGGVALLQTVIVYGIVAWFCNFPGRDDGFAARTQVATALMTGLLGTLMGLAISAEAKTEEVAVRTVPLVLIPQIVLANVIASLDGALQWLAMASVSTYWTFEAFTSGVDAFCKPGDDAPAFFPAMTVILLHCSLLLGISAHGLITAKSAGGGAR